MNQSETFKDRLLAELKADVATTGARAGSGAARVPYRTPVRRRRMLAAAGALAVLAAVATPILFGQRGVPAAWAVEKRADGTIEVRIRDARDAAGLERRLNELGVPAYVTFVPEGMECIPRSDGLTGSKPGLFGLEPERAGLIGMTPSGLLPGIEPKGKGVVVIDPGAFPPGKRLMLNQFGKEMFAFLYVPLAAERCQIVPQWRPAPSAGAAAAPGSR